MACRVACAPPNNNNQKPCTPLPFTAECQQLHCAFKGFGCDEATVIRILASKKMHERQQIRKTYFALFKHDLIARLKSELRGNLEKAIVWWMHDAATRDAMIAKEALEGWRTDNRGLTEIICTRSSVDIARIRESYFALTQRCLDDEVVCKTKGAFQRLLLALLKSHRCGAAADVDINAARCEAKALYEAAAWGGSELQADVFIRVLSTHNVAQLKATFRCYKEMYGKDIMKALDHDKRRGSACGCDAFSKDFAEAARVCIKSVYAPAQYFAKEINRALKGLCNDDHAVARIIVTRAEVDLKHINEVFFRKYKVGLLQTFQSELSGHFKEFCLAVAFHHAGIFPNECFCN
eukprot:TRINITY_DN79_c0_g1_i4.p1 TRINITY_DN79_c0_g1~~TRINITY_DN79_c0_g1_i4.p1  ORF type:complete len:350 (+),score=-22.14 TRINITY_DN79_c0_g1_i4:79-1128(+)